MDYFFHIFCLNIKAMFGKGMDLRKWTSTVADLIDVRNKSKDILYKKSNKILFCSDFFYLNSNKK